MVFDIIYVTYNSHKWIDSCFRSLVKCDYPNEKLNIIVVDNNSKDDTIDALNNIELTIGHRFASFKVIKSQSNLGFGAANNLGAEHSNSEIICFFNIDTTVKNNTFDILKEKIEQSELNIGGWELRQFPYEHPKKYDILTGYTSWCSGASFVVRRNILNQVNRFDKKIFLYAEDVDLSWRIRDSGYELKYIPEAVIMHYTYSEKDEIKPQQYINSIINNINLRLKFGNVKDILEGSMNMIRILLFPTRLKNSKMNLIKQGIYNLHKMPYFFMWRPRKNNRKFKPQFYGWDYEIARKGAFYENHLPISTPLVSILIRTCGRYEVLREAIISVKNQTYKNIEIVIVEDGPNVSEKNIMSEFKNLNIVYRSTDYKVGRSKVGNIALNLSRGEYINFLDDDDLLYADHVEVLVSEFERNAVEVLYTSAFEVSTHVEDKFEDKVEKEYKIVYEQPFNRMKLFYENYIPIQSAMFKRDIINDGIFLDEQMDALEDWDFWIRIACKFKFKFIDKTTSLYRVPSEKQIKVKRQNTFNNALNVVRQKQKQYYIQDNSYNLVEDMIEVLNQNGIDKLKLKFPKMYKIYKLIKNR